MSQSLLLLFVLVASCSSVWANSECARLFSKAEAIGNVKSISYRTENLKSQIQTIRRDIKDLDDQFGLIRVQMGRPRIANENDNLNVHMITNAFELPNTEKTTKSSWRNLHGFSVSGPFNSEYLLSVEDIQVARSPNLDDNSRKIIVDRFNRNQEGYFLSKVEVEGLIARLSEIGHWTDITSATISMVSQDIPYLDDHGHSDFSAVDDGGNLNFKATVRSGDHGLDLIGFLRDPRMGTFMSKEFSEEKVFEFGPNLAEAITDYLHDSGGQRIARINRVSSITVTLTYKKNIAVRTSNATSWMAKLNEISQLLEIYGKQIGRYQSQIISLIREANDNLRILGIEEVGIDLDNPENMCGHLCKALSTVSSEHNDIGLVHE